MQLVLTTVELGILLVIDDRSLSFVIEVPPCERSLARMLGDILREKLVADVLPDAMQQIGIAVAGEIPKKRSAALQFL